MKVNFWNSSSQEQILQESVETNTVAFFDQIEVRWVGDNLGTITIALKEAPSLIVKVENPSRVINVWQNRRVEARTGETILYAGKKTEK